MTRLWCMLLGTLLLLALTVPDMARSQDPSAKAEPKADEKEKPKDKEKEKEKEKPKGTGDEAPVVTHHEVTVGGKPLKYTATTGFIPISDAEGKVEARIFYVAYTADGVDDTSKRPLMFSFNGGPGSSSVWLHLGALGPKRVPLPDDATIPAPPYRLVDNEQTWLDKTDLVFIDPVETGYSRAARPELNKKFHGLRGDIDSVGEFVRMYLTRNERWGSPLFVVGESYGTTRAAGLSGSLIEKGIAFNGVILISTVLDFQTLRFGRTNDVPYTLYLPTFTATAWYHKKLPDDLQRAGVAKAVEEAAAWAESDYRAILDKGDRATAGERRAAAKKLARYTGLSEQFVDLNDLRVSQPQFCRELLRDKRRSVGRLDSRYLGITESGGGGGGGGGDFDPSEAAIRSAYTATFNRYVRADLGYKTDAPYHILGGGQIGVWDFGPAGSGYPETSSGLRQALAKNPHMKVWVAAGYYDLATPVAAAEYTLAHLKLGPHPQAGNLSFTKYEAGHMMYVHSPSLAKLKEDAAKFLDASDGD